MLEAAPADLVWPSAWSAAPQIFSYPQLPGRLPHLLVRFAADYGPAVVSSARGSDRRAAASQWFEEAEPQGL